MLANEPKAINEIHAIRAQNYERTKDLSPAERSRMRSESVMPIMKKYKFRIVPKRNNSSPHRRAK